MNYHRERFRKLTFRALALRQSECLPNFCFDLPHLRSTTVSLETRNPAWLSSCIQVLLWLLDIVFLGYLQINSLANCLPLNGFVKFIFLSIVTVYWPSLQGEWPTKPCCLVYQCHSIVTSVSWKLSYRTHECLSQIYS